MRRALPLLVATLAAACGRPPAPAPVASAGTPCRILSADRAADPLVIGVPEAVDRSNAPAPATEAERFVFGTFYETLVRLDCEGRALPALASRWAQEDPRRWRFTLRADARFWDGTPVTATAVLAAWNGRPLAGAESLTALDERTVRVVWAEADTGVLRRLADPRHAVATPGVPLGTTPYPITAWRTGRIEAPRVSFVVAPGADPRDLLDQGADLVVTDDPEALRYAGSRADLDVVPLPWSWTYVFVGAAAVWDGDSTALPGLRDAVRGDVRVAEGPFWWRSAPRCAGAGGPPRRETPGGARAIGYPEADPVARDIAQRLVALADRGRAFPGAGSLRALPMTPADLAQPAAESGALGLVTAIPRHSYRSCLDLPAGVVVPLLDGRSSVVARRGRVSLAVDWDGTPRLVWP